MDEIEKYKLANSNLSEKLDKELKTNERMYFELEGLRGKTDQLEKAYHGKMRVSRIVVEHDNMSFVLQTLKSVQTPDGLFITGRI